MAWLLVGAAVFLFGTPLLLRWIPPHTRYFSHRKRRAMSLAQRAFEADHPESRMDWAGSWVYRADAEKCFVFVQHNWPGLHPPNYAGYVVWHVQEQIDRLGGWQFHWGILPRHAVEQYESCRGAEVPWLHG